MKRETKKKTLSPKREFTREYKEEALKLWESSGWRSKETAESLGIDPQYFPKWQRQLQRAGRAGAPHSAGASQPVVAGGSDAVELARLRRENAQLRMERDILKKAALIFGDRSHT
jgi:transposase